jgi:AraC family transcriptional regulator, regulatory protein of adaptative response / methylated-DNA-[protein]-cysteine methyltransferase
MAPTPAQWRAVQKRDRRFDGQFVFAVRSTGIYCHPSCPSRRPGLDQVQIYQDSEIAQAAGYRPCRRCHPDRPLEDPPRTVLIRRICAWIDANLDRNITLKALSPEFGISPHHLQRIFKASTGLSPRQYVLARRLRKFKEHVRKGHAITSALYEAGYSSSSRLYEKAQTHLGMTPRAYQQGGRGMLIQYATAKSAFGRMLVATTERGLCFLCLGASDSTMKKALREEYPSADIHYNPVKLKTSVDLVLRHLRGEKANLDIPLDVQATAFQWQVWKKLMTIPYGATRTYSQIARSLGRPRANRAVARACATNRVSLVIPCHRVIRADGKLGGYRWGLDRKKALLRMEQETAR